MLERYFKLQAGSRGQDTLQLAVVGLEGALNRYEPLPSLMAENPIFLQLLKSPGNLQLVKQANETLRLSASRLKASDIYIMDVRGTTVASSNYRKQHSFLGQNFSYRPYFTQALEGGTGRFFALGVMSGERGYFFAAPIEDKARVIGVVALKVSVDEFEEAWRHTDHKILVTDLNGVIFMASQPDWHFRTIRQLSSKQKAAIEVYRQYPKHQLKPLMKTAKLLEGNLETVTIEDQRKTTKYVSSAVYLPNAAWNIRILIPTSRAETQAMGVLLILVLMIMLIGLALAFYIQRRARLLERLQVQQEAQEFLETRVAERTADLNRTNAKLLAEVSERKAAEGRLRKTQRDLVQAGKLAALGQMSAALSHEFNQPLAAVKSYADNAIRLMERGRTDDTRDNILRISDMADRMAEISKHLRNFARKPAEKVRPVELVPILNDAISLLQPRLRATTIDLTIPQDAPQITVMGGHIRLQQVIVNLLSNAIDAMKGQENAVIEVFLEDFSETCRLRIRDHGPGISEDLFEEVFDPFFSTKEPGEGMGLGLSISYNIIKDFDGNLDVSNCPDGGAVFELTLRKSSSLKTTLAPEQETKETA